MKSRFLIIILVFISFALAGIGSYADAQTDAVEYNEALARQLGADDYGMRSYTLVMLRTGPQSAEDKEWVSRCFRGHLDNINRLVDEGKLILAGPLGTNEKNYRGIFILTETQPDSVQALLHTDPAIREHLLVADTYIWYGSAALPLYLDASRKIVKKKP